MDAEKVKELVKDLVELMKANDLSEMKIIDGETEIMLKCGGQAALPQVVALPPVVALAPGSNAPAARQPTAEGASAEAAENDSLLEITSPLVGTYYATPSPTANPFVEVGSHVDKDTVVCIVEAMKVMNEIKSDVVGTIKEVLVTNGAAIEFAQPLFLVEPD